MKNNTYQTARSAGLKSSQLSCWTAVAAATAQQITHPYLSHPYLFLFPPHSLSRSQHPPSLLVSLSLPPLPPLSSAPPPPLLLHCGRPSSSSTGGAVVHGRTGGPRREGGPRRGGGTRTDQARPAGLDSASPASGCRALAGMGTGAGQRAGAAARGQAQGGGDGRSSSSPLPTLLLSARRGLCRRRISPSPAAYPPPPLRSARTAMGGVEQHAAAGKRSSAGGPSGARGRLVAVGYVSVREFLASLFRDTRTRRGYVSRPYPRRIRVGYVSNTGYAPSLPYPCF